MEPGFEYPFLLLFRSLDNFVLSMTPNCTQLHINEYLAIDGDGYVIE